MGFFNPLNARRSRRIPYTTANNTNEISGLNVHGPTILPIVRNKAAAEKRISNRPI
jgi:hypothetical protein